MSLRISILRLGGYAGLLSAALCASAGQRAQIVLRGRAGSEKALIVFIKTEPPKTHLRIAVDTLPSFSHLVSQLPRGTKQNGDRVRLPNGSEFVLVQAQPPDREKAAFAARTVTRGQLVVQLQGFKAHAAKATVKARRLGTTAYTVIGDLSRAIIEAPYLPNGTEVVAVLQGEKMTYPFGRLVGAPDFPKPHTAKNPGLRWTQEAGNGRWEEVPVKTQKGLHWVQRADGYWEEAPRQK